MFCSVFFHTYKILKYIALTILSSLLTWTYCDVMEEFNKRSLMLGNSQ
jgi:hypothetical protein